MTVTFGVDVSETKFALFLPKNATSECREIAGNFLRQKTLSQASYVNFLGCKSSFWMSMESPDSPLQNGICHFNKYRTFDF